MDISQYIESVASEGDLFAAAAAHGDLGVEIAGCAGWDMRALVRHLGLIHLWAAGNVAFPSDDWLDADDIPDMARYWPDLGAAWPADGGLVEWYRRTNSNLVDVLESAPPDHECFSFLPAPTPVTMWARRQASEIAIHRFDAERARGMPSHFEPEFAADMLDELLCGFGPRQRANPLDVESHRVLHVHADDVDEHWYLTIGRDGVDAVRPGGSDDVELGAGSADLDVTGTAAALYVLMWNRTDESAVRLDGEVGLLELWLESCRVQWSGGE